MSDCKRIIDEVVPCKRPVIEEELHPFAGPPGGTFIPKVTDVAEGHTLSWTNNAGLPNPEPVLIKNGKDGGSGGTLEKLTFTGAVSAEYDGTSPVTVEIPSGGGGGVSQEYVDQQDTATLDAAKTYADGKLVTIDIVQRSEGVFWTDPSTTGNEIIDMVNAGKEVRLHFFDTLTDTGDQLYPYETTKAGVPYFRRNVITANKASRINIGVQYNGEVKFTDVPYVPPVQTAFAVSNDPAASPTSGPCTWYIPKTMPKPSANVGLMVDVLWKNGRVNGLGYNVSLVWGAEGEVGNEVILSATSVTDDLTGEYSIPAEGTVRYQLVSQNDRLHWKYVSGKLLPKQYSSATAAETADKVVPGMQIAYLPGMEAYVQLDNGNTAETMRLVPDSGETLPVYGNGTGTKTGAIPAGYILHLVDAGDHWQIINAAGGGLSEIPIATADKVGGAKAKPAGVGDTQPVTIDPVTGEFRAPEKSKDSEKLGEKTPEQLFIHGSIVEHRKYTVPGDRPVTWQYTIFSDGYAILDYFESGQSAMNYQTENGVIFLQNSNDFGIVAMPIKFSQIISSYFCVRSSAETDTTNIFTIVQHPATDHEYLPKFFGATYKAQNNTLKLFAYAHIEGVIAK